MALTKVANTLLDFTGGFVAGNVSFPAITTVGDTNTGIYFPAADTIAFAEGGVESARIDSVGNFGLGFTPSVQYSGIKSLQIGSTTNLFDQGVSTKLYHNAYTAASGDDTHLINGYAQAYLMPSNGHHIWYISTSGTAGNSISFSQAMTLNASGYLGVGETSPSDMLDVKGNARVGQGQVVATSTVGSVGIYSGITSGSGNSQLKFFGKSVDNTGLTYELSRISGGSFGTFGIDGGLSFSTALNNGSNVLTLSERARIDATGRFMIGTTLPTTYGFLAVAKTVTIGSIEASAGFSDAVNSTFRITHGGGFVGLNFDCANLNFQSGGTGPTTRMSITNTGSVNIVGALSKGSGSFRIEHPLPEKSETHELVHSFIEGPQADLIYRGKVNLVNGTATVNIDLASSMTQGTFEVLCRDVQCFTTNESGWNHVRGSVTGNTLTIECQDQTASDLISWMVIGERKDKHMMDTDWTDESGKVIVEPLKPAHRPIEENQVSAITQLLADVAALKGATP